MKFKDVSPKKGMLIVSVAQEIDVRIQAKMDPSWEAFGQSFRWEKMKRGMPPENQIEFEATYKELYETEVLPNLEYLVDQVVKRDREGV